MNVLVPNITINNVEALPVFNQLAYTFVTAEEQTLGFLNEFSWKIIK